MKVSSALLYLEPSFKKFKVLVKKHYKPFWILILMIASTPIAIGTLNFSSTLTILLTVLSIIKVFVLLTLIMSYAKQANKELEEKWDKQLKEE